MFLVYSLESILVKSMTLLFILYFLTPVNLMYLYIPQLSNNYKYLDDLKTNVLFCGKYLNHLLCFCLHQTDLVIALTVPAFVTLKSFPFLFGSQEGLWEQVFMVTHTPLTCEWMHGGDEGQCLSELGTSITRRFCVIASRNLMMGGKAIRKNNRKTFTFWSPNEAT